MRTMPKTISPEDVLDNLYLQYIELAEQTENPNIKVQYMYSAELLQRAIQRVLLNYNNGVANG